MSKTPETVLKDAVVAYLNKTGTFYRRMHAGGKRVKGGFLYLGPEGTADFLVFQESRPYWLELKAGATAKARKAAQAAFADEVRALGHTYALCESLDDVIAALSGVTIREI